MRKTSIRDLLYFDLEKASSILSQFDWGLIEQISITQDEMNSQGGGGKVGIPEIAGIEFQADKQNKYSILETKKIHHDLLNRVESQLTAAGLVSDLISANFPDNKNIDHIHEFIGTKPYIKAEGWSVIEDYQRITNITNNLNEIMGYFIENQLNQNSQLSELKIQIDDKKSEIAKINDRNRKSKEKAILKTFEDKLVSLTEEVKNDSMIDQSLLDGIKLWINTFMVNRINFRIYPYYDIPSFQILCNLKRDCFVDQNIEHLLYGYGNKPNISLSVFGLITSFPKNDVIKFDPLDEFVDNNLDDLQFEKSFRGIFSVIDEFESYLRFSRYPNITIHPIAVFREFKINEKDIN